MNRWIIAACSFACAAFPLRAGSRASAAYNMPAESMDAGGKRTASVHYTNDGSLGGIAGLSVSAAPSSTLEAGYAAQLFSAGLTLSALSTVVNETAALQLSASLTLEDGTVTAIPAASVAWSVRSGPLTAVSPGGLVTAGIVYQNTGATVTGTYAGQTAMLGITVANLFPDNYGAYAGDVLADDWQVQHFGLNNPAAGPDSDPDGDGQNNLLEFTAGLVPVSSLSRFFLNIEPVPGFPGQMRLVFSPLVTGRHYVVEFNPSPAGGTWSLLTGGIESDQGSERTVIDNSAGGPRKFYRVKVVKP